MEVTQSTIDEIITMMISSGIDDRSLASLDLIAASPLSAEAFVKTLIARRVDGGEKIEDALEKTQQLFERIADSSESAACAFMAHLWPIACKQTGLYDVCDSIDLWLANHDGEGIAEHSKYIAASADHEKVREHFHQIAARAGL